MKKTNTNKDFRRLHLYYQKRAYTRLIKDFRKMLKSIKFDNLSYEFAEAVISLNINDEALQKTLFNLYLDIGNKYGRHVVRDIESEKKATKPYPLFSERFQEFIISFFQNEGGQKVVSLTDTMTKKVMRVISDAQAEGLTQREMATLVQKTVNKPNFYRYNAMRIARTESLFSMNSAKQVSFETSDIAMDKVWQHGGSGHPRADHLLMDGEVVGYDQYFTLPNGERMLYPGDPSGSAENVINCSCSFSYRPQRDSSGDLIYK